MNQDPSAQSSGQVPMTPDQPAVNPVLLWVFIVVLLVGGGYFAWIYLGPKTAEAPMPTSSTTMTKSSAVSPSASVTASTTASPSASVSASVMEPEFEPVM